MEWSEHVHLALRASQLKRGGARERVIRLLASQACALTAAEIERSLREKGEPTSRATVYRVLEMLVEHGLVERVEIGDGQTRFERTRSAHDHHHHLVCEQCGRLVAFDDPGLEQAIGSLSERLGVRVNSHDVLLRGACGRCYHVST